MLQPIAAGDLITDDAWTPNTGGTVGPDAERMRAVQITPVAGGNQLDVVFQRNISQACGVLASQQTPAGWSIMMAASGPWTCEGSVLTIDILNKVVYGENRNIDGGHPEYGVGVLPNTTTLIAIGTLPDGNAGYAVRASKPLSSIGQPADFFINFDPQFASIRGVPQTMLQSYTAMEQWGGGLSDFRWALDFRHINGGFGISEESNGTTLAPNTATLVAGTTSVYKLSTIGSVNVKTIPLLAYAGRSLLREMSGPTTGDVITDANPWRSCYAYKAGECRHDSTSGVFTLRCLQLPSQATARRVSTRATFPAR